MKEYGLLGQVKTMTQYKYFAKSILKKDSLYQLPDKKEYEYKRTYFFNERGNIDSVLTFYPYVNNDTKEIIPIYNYIINEFDKTGNKKGFRFLTGGRKLEEHGEIKWIDDSHYLQTNYGLSNDGQKAKVEEILFTLTTECRELLYEVKKFGRNNGVLLNHYIVSNSFDKDGYLQKRRVEYKSSDGGWDEDKYKHQKFDMLKNPLETIQFTGYNNTPKYFITTEYSYYKKSKS